MQTPLWKRILIWGICALGLLYALPNLFYSRVETHNDAAAAIEAAGGTATAEQEAAVALWPDWVPSGLVNLGLDLRGGAHLLAEVQVADVYKDRIDLLWPEVRDALRAERDTVGAVRRQPSEDGVLKVRISNPAGMPRALEVVRGLATPVTTLTGVGAIGHRGDGRGRRHRRAVVRGRTGRDRQPHDPAVARDHPPPGGRGRHPRTDDPASGRRPHPDPGAGHRLGGRTQGADRHDGAADLQPGRRAGRPTPTTVPGPRNILLPSADEEGVFYVIEQHAGRVSGEELVDAQPAFDQNGRPAVNFRFNPTGARAFGDYTAAQHRAALRHRAGRRGDLGPHDPVGDPRRVGHHHRQLHGRGKHRPCRAAARRCAAGRADLPRGTDHRAGTGAGQHRCGQDCRADRHGRCRAPS